MNLDSISTPKHLNLLIAFADIQGFAGVAEKLPESLELFAFLKKWADLCTDTVEARGGRILKFIGDSFLSIFPEDGVDAGVMALLAAKRESEKHFLENGFSSKLRITVHFGEVAIGPMGKGNGKKVDIIGKEVNVAALLGHGEHRGRVIISPQVFRHLSAETRKLFHKYTPPIVYLAGN